MVGPRKPQDGNPESEATQQRQPRHEAKDGAPLTNEAFVGLLIANDHRVRGFLVSLMLPSSEVEDVFQNTSVTAFRKIGSFRYHNDTPEEEFVRWVCTIAKYEVLRYYQKAQRSKVVFSSELIEELADTQLEMQHELGARHDALHRCVEDMPARQRELIKMRYGAGEAVAGIADRLGVTPSGVYKSLSTIRSALLRCIETRIRSTEAG